MTIDTAPVFSDVQKENPSSIIELFVLELKEGLNYATGNPTGIDTVFRFHAGAAEGNIVVNVDASGSSVEGDSAQSEQFGRALAAAIQSELIQQQRPGGLLS